MFLVLQIAKTKWLCWVVSLLFLLLLNHSIGHAVKVSWSRDDTSRKVGSLRDFLMYIRIGLDYYFLGLDCGSRYSRRVFIGGNHLVD